VIHTDLGFAASWGAFPLLTGYVAQAEGLGVAAALGAVAALGFSYAQRTLSTPSRVLRRRVSHVEGSVVMADGTIHPLDGATLRRPLERALQTLSWSMVALAVGFVIARLA
jgi:hypothetical protein